MTRGKKKNAKSKQNNKPKQQAPMVVVVPKPTARPRKKPKKQSRSNMVIPNTPAAYNGRVITKPFMQRSVRLKGCDLLATVSVAAGSDNTFNGGPLGYADLNPLLLFPGGRLSQFAELFDKYKYNSLRIVYVPNVGTTASGAFIIAADPDVLDDYSTYEGDSFVQALNNTMHNMTAPVYQTMDITVKDKKFFTDTLYCDPSSTTADGARWASPGKIWWGNAGALAAATAYGRIYVDWDITFSEPSNDSDNSAGLALIGTVDSTKITSTYPWGDFTAIRNAFTPGSSFAFYGRPYCSFYSDSTLGSVIKFNASGFYHLNFVRTGTAMGTGAFSSAVLTNCVYGWPSNPSGLGPFNNSISNGGSTQSQWSVCIYSNQPGATISSTGDSGVTHTAGWVFVTKVNLFVYPGGGFTAERDQLKSRLEQLESFMRNFSPKPLLGACLTGTGETTTVEDDPSGGPSKVSVSTTAQTIDNGTSAVNVVTPGEQFVMVNRDTLASFLKSNHQ